MSRYLPFLLLSLPLVACGGEDEIVATGMHYTYVVSEAAVPASNPQATEYGLDLNGDKVVDNQLGAVLAALVTQGFDVQSAIKGAVDEGDIILLLDLQTPSFSSAGGAGLKVKLGANPMPAPCTDTADTVCRKHLAGTGTFGISPSSPADAGVVGKVVGGTFNGGPGSISIQIALGSQQGITLELIGARAKASGMSETGIDSVVVGGALTESDLNTQVIPAIHSQLGPIIMGDCPGTTPPDCGCATGSTGRTILNLFDTNPKNCIVTVEEISGNTLIKSLLAPDVMIDGQAALSLGIKVKAVKGTFPTE